MILVTGATGMVGAHLVLKLIESNEQVVALYRNEIGKSKTENIFKINQKEALFSKINWVQADVLDVPSLEIAFQNITKVYHCAAIISFDPNDEEKLRKTNIEGTANIVNFCLNRKVEKLCFVSSIAAIGDLLPNETTLTEASEWNPEKQHSDYAITKYGAEMEVWRAHYEGLKVVIVNPGVILGKGFYEQGSGELFSILKKGIPFYTKGSTGYVGVDDVVKIMIQLMQSEINGERFILVAENLKYKEIFDVISPKIKVKSPSFKLKKWHLSVLWKLDWFLHLVFRTKRKLSKASALSLVDKTTFSNQKVIDEFGFSFQKIEDVISEIAIDFCTFIKK